ncbi:hypothetical protein BESB_052270 [Besnoitia besnoiti]|uniref:Man1/Src1-like C-terminal domain-containing protein n=1 Tax=Besnoitia besnoiti TaxID=94643 RepID=A0A2A9MHZ4_BESBE|nr:hypothetical protein BESB_052270 [Besnoitia besnoiti]PFH35576.1 hypothetical protein BESB_052270 [Besnoitia besnoiti]
MEVFAPLEAPGGSPTGRVLSPRERLASARREGGADDVFRAREDVGEDALPSPLPPSPDPGSSSSASADRVSPDISRIARRRPPVASGARADCPAGGEPPEETGGLRTRLVERQLRRELSREPRGEERPSSSGRLPEGGKPTKGKSRAKSRVGRRERRQKEAPAQAAACATSSFPDSSSLGRSAATAHASSPSSAARFVAQEKREANSFSPLLSRSFRWTRGGVVSAASAQGPLAARSSIFLLLALLVALPLLSAVYRALFAAPPPALEEARGSLPYCTKTRDLPQGLLEGEAVSSSLLAGDERPDCRPCPPHAVCANGAMRCPPPYIRVAASSAVAERLLPGAWSRSSAVGRGAARVLAALFGSSGAGDAQCVEDLSAKKTAQDVADALVLFLRQKAGQAQCGTLSHLDAQQPAAVSSAGAGSAFSALASLAAADEGEETRGEAAPQEGRFAFPRKGLSRGKAENRETSFWNPGGQRRGETDAAAEGAEAPTIAGSHSGSLRDRNSFGQGGGKTPRERSGGVPSLEAKRRVVRLAASATRWDLVQLAHVRDALEDDNVYAFVFNHFLEEKAAERDFSVLVEQNYSFQSLDSVVPEEKSGASRRKQTDTLLAMFLREQRRSRGITYTYTYAGRLAIRPWSCTLYVTVMYRVVPLALVVLLVVLLSLPLAFWLRRAYLRRQLRALLLMRRGAAASSAQPPFTLKGSSIAAAFYPGISSSELSHLLVRSLLRVRGGRLTRWWLQRLARNPAEVDTLCHDLLIDRHVRVHTARLGDQNFWWVESGSDHPPVRAETGTAGAGAYGAADLRASGPHFLAGASGENTAEGAQEYARDPRQSLPATLLQHRRVSGGLSLALPAGEPAQGSDATVGNRGEAALSDAWLSERVRRSSAYQSACRLGRSSEGEAVSGFVRASRGHRATLGGLETTWRDESSAAHVDALRDTLTHRRCTLEGGKTSWGAATAAFQSRKEGLAAVSQSERAGGAGRPLPTLIGGGSLGAAFGGRGSVGDALQFLDASNASRAQLASKRRSSARAGRAGRDYSHAAFLDMAERSRKQEPEGVYYEDGAPTSQETRRGSLGFVSTRASTTGKVQ